MVVNIDEIKYPHINHFYNADPNIEAFLGRKLYVQEKLDGSNAGFYLNHEGEVEIRSRNNSIADKYNVSQPSGRLSPPEFLEKLKQILGGGCTDCLIPAECKLYISKSPCLPRLIYDT